MLLEKGLDINGAQLVRLWIRTGGVAARCRLIPQLVGFSAQCDLNVGLRLGGAIGEDLC